MTRRRQPLARSGLLASLLLAGLASGCQQQPEPAAPSAPASDAQAIGESCSQDCGGGKVAAITCAEGETPVCDCGATPSAACKVPPAGAGP